MMMILLCFCLLPACFADDDDDDDDDDYTTIPREDVCTHTCTYFTLPLPLRTLRQQHAQLTHTAFLEPC